MPGSAGVSYSSNNIVDKIAADANFIELTNLVAITETKINSLTIEDKMLFKKYAQCQNVSELAKLYTKSGIDFKAVSLKKMKLIKNLNNKYKLNRRSDKAEILSSALLLSKSPFAQCLMGLMMGTLGCELGDPNQYYVCRSPLPYMYFRIAVVILLDSWFALWQTNYPYYSEIFDRGGQKQIP